MKKKYQLQDQKHVVFVMVQVQNLGHLLRNVQHVMEQEQYAKYKIQYLVKCKPLELVLHAMEQVKS